MKKMIKENYFEFERKRNEDVGEVVEKNALLFTVLC